MAQSIAYAPKGARVSVSARLQRLVNDYRQWRAQDCRTMARRYDIKATRATTIRMFTALPVGMMGFILTAEDAPLLSMAFLALAWWAVRSAKADEESRKKA